MKDTVLRFLMYFRSFLFSFIFEQDFIYPRLASNYYIAEGDLQFIFFKSYYFLIYVYEYFACMYTCIPCVCLVPTRPEEGVRSLRMKVIDGYAISTWVLGSKSRSCRGVLLTVELSLALCISDTAASNPRVLRVHVGNRERPEDVKF